MNTMGDKPEPFYLTGGQRRLIVEALAMMRDLCETSRAQAEDKHSRWKFGLRMRQCDKVARIMLSRWEDRQTRAEKKARAIFDRMGSSAPARPDEERG